MRCGSQSQWFRWIEKVPAFAEMPPEAISSLLDYMVLKGILWSDNGILAFATEGESIFGRKNFMEILSVFTSPPLFKVVSGQKELGFVHESAFYRREDGPAVLVLAGRSWKTNNLDWKRRVAHVEPSEGKGRSRWLGEGQMLSNTICQSIRRILSSGEPAPEWSRRASNQLEEIRNEHPWVSPNSTTLVRHSNGEVRWWTFAGGIANTLLSDSLKSKYDVSADNLSLRFRAADSVDAVAKLIDGLRHETIKPIPNSDAIDNLKFSECLPPEIASQVFLARFQDKAAIQRVMEEPTKIIVQAAGD